MSFFRPQPRWARIHLKDGKTFEGISWPKRAGHYKVESCSLLERVDGGQLRPTLFAGTCEFQADDVLLRQVLR